MGWLEPEWLGVLIGVVGVLIGLGSLVVGIGALVFAWLAWWVSAKELRLTEEEATLRPELMVSVEQVSEDLRVPESVAPHDQRAITFRIENRGRTAAHGIYCDFYLPLDRLSPDDSEGGNRTYQREYIRPSGWTTHGVSVNVLAHGVSEVHYVCICDEVGRIAGDLQVPIRAPEVAAEQDGEEDEE